MLSKKNNANVPLRYKTGFNYGLGSWVQRQRASRNQLTIEQQSKLDSLGFDWDPLGTAWNKSFAYLAQYVNKEGHARVPAGYKQGKLGLWVSRQRKNKGQLSKECVTRLNSVGFDWDPYETDWEEGFAYLIKYVDLTGHARVSNKYKDEGFNLGSWVSTQRKNKDGLTIKRKIRLESLDGWCWDALDVNWEDGFVQLSQYLEEEGDVNVPVSYKTEHEYKLGQWIVVQRRNREKITAYRKERLESLKGWSWGNYK